MIRWHEIENVERIQDEVREARAIYDSKWPEVLRYLHTKDNVIEKNEICRAGQMSGDGSIINISGAGEGNVIRQNYIHHIFNRNLHGAIRTDDFQVGTLIEQNVIYKTNSCGIILRHENYAINNVVCDVHPGCYMWIGQRRIDGTRIERNIFLHTGRPKKTRDRYAWHGLFYALAWRIINEYNVFQHIARMEAGDIDGNIYFDTGNIEGSSKVIDERRAIGHERNGCYEDPCFEDWENGDFRLREDSPARRLGITSIDVRDAGIRQGWYAK